MNAGQPLAEVFGFTTTDQSDSAKRYRSHRLCPFTTKSLIAQRIRQKTPWVSVPFIMTNILSLHARFDSAKIGESLMTLQVFSSGTGRIGAL